MKKICVLSLMILNMSCAALMNPQEQPVHLINSTNKIYSTTCSGMAETIGTCHLKAKKTCTKGYNLIEEKVDSSGVHRSIKFQCNN